MSLETGLIFNEIFLEFLSCLSDKCKTKAPSQSHYDASFIELNTFLDIIISEETARESKIHIYRAPLADIHMR